MKNKAILIYLILIGLAAGICNAEYNGGDQMQTEQIPLLIDEAKLIASDGAANDYFGSSVSIDGDYAIVGAYGDDDNGSYSGSAYIYKRDGTTWSQQTKLTASDGDAKDRFGWSVSIDGDYAIIGAYLNDDNVSYSGSAYIFKRNGTTWSQQAELTASDRYSSYRFGISVSIDGDYAIVGAIYGEGNGSRSGSAYIFKRDGATWSQQTKLTASDGAAYNYFGRSVSIDGDYAIVGAYGDDDNGSKSGSAYIFKRDETTWSEQAKLTALDGAAYDEFGGSVSIDGDYAIAGTFYDEDSVSYSGSAYIFKRDGTAWSQQAKLTTSDGDSGDYFGNSVSIDGDYAIVGAYYDDDNGRDSGSAYIFKRYGITWVGYMKLTASDGGESTEHFGGSVSIDGGLSIVGADYDDDNGYLSGSAYIFSTPYPLVVTAAYPPVDFNSIGYPGGPFVPPSKSYTLTNIGPNSLDWTATATKPWLDITPSSGTLGPGALSTMVLSINAIAENFPTGYYTCKVHITNVTAGNSPYTILVSLRIHQPGQLRVPSEFATIQDAIDVAYLGDTVIVAPSTYTGPGNRDIDFLGKSITVCSTNPNDPNIVAATIIDCNGTEAEPHRGFIFHSDEDGNSVLAGLTIMNGYATLGGGIYCCTASPSIRKCNIWHNTSAYSSGQSARGGGIYCHSGSPQISNCVISHNSVTGNIGGGIYCIHSDLKIIDSIISMNGASTGTGGGIYCNKSSPKILNCTINGNISQGYGGIMLYKSNATIADCIVSDNKGRGITAHESGCIIKNCIIRGNSGTEGSGVNAHAWPPLNVTITNCLISGNISSQNGGGLKVATSGHISNCTIVGNSAPIGGGLYKCFALLNNCIIWGNSPEQIVDQYDATIINYSDIQGGWPGIGNIDYDPCFVDPGCWADVNDANIIVEPNDPNAVWIDGDYHLLPDSPCINAGDPNPEQEWKIYIENERHWSYGPGLVGLNRRNVDISTIVVTDYTGLVIYTESEDYEIIVSNEGIVSLKILADGRLANGWTFFVDYIYMIIIIPGDEVTDLDGNPRIIGGRIDMGAYESNYIKVPMHFTPRTLNPKSKGKWIKAHFILPDDFTIEDVNTNSPARLVEPFTAESVYMDVFLNEGGLVKIVAAFDRADFCSNGSMLEDIVVIGRLTTGQYFYGTDTIRIKTNNLEYLAVLTYHWLRTDCKNPHWCEGSDINQDGTVDFIDFALFDGCCLEFIKN